VYRPLLARPLAGQPPSTALEVAYPKVCPEGLTALLTAPLREANQAFTLILQAVGRRAAVPYGGSRPREFPDFPGGSAAADET
jgi:hypothetical protein